MSNVNLVGFVHQYGANDFSIWNVELSTEDEKAINAFRDSCRDKELKEIERKGDSYFETVFYLDILEEMEQMGDFLINISQAI